ncbi:hypothetical protein OG455_27885 [Kitasatospora sp. NBC_01287]|uniref:hypothetical protein n=1 Tax=Kitasatospora sp. NBC_01287 TaxID=2903573 RepID=UPI00225663C0|nr:hypothetical protein [Kitasatospora sp. NBC_01287]MCX4749283.1 hypothetical protein [Kitasatospora sp. NBC_01287]
MTTTATFTLGQHIRAGLHLHGHSTTHDHRTPGGGTWISLNLPGGTSIRISDYTTDTDIDADQRTGLQAIHHLGDPRTKPEHTITIHRADRTPGPDSLHTDITALAEAVTLYINLWNGTPAGRNTGRQIHHHAFMDLPTRLLRRGDVIVHTGSGSRAVLTELTRLGRNEYRRTSRTTTPPSRGGSASLPATYWQFPWTYRQHGNQIVTVAAHQHVDPASLPPIPYPDVPAHFRDGDHVVHDSTIWHRTDGAWFNHIRTTHTPPTSDNAIRRLFTDDNHLRLGIPAYQPAHH